MISNGYIRMTLHPIIPWDDYPEMACRDLTSFASRTHQRMLSESSRSTSDGYMGNWCLHGQHFTEFRFHGEELSQSQDILNDYLPKMIILNNPNVLHHGDWFLSHNQIEKKFLELLLVVSFYSNFSLIITQYILLNGFFFYIILKIMSPFK